MALLEVAAASRTLFAASAISNDAITPTLHMTAVTCVTIFNSAAMAMRHSVQQQE